MWEWADVLWAVPDDRAWLGKRSHNTPTQSNTTCLRLAANWIGSTSLPRVSSRPHVPSQPAGWACPRQHGVPERSVGRGILSRSLAWVWALHILPISSKAFVTEWLVRLIWGWWPITSPLWDEVILSIKCRGKLTVVTIVHVCDYTRNHCIVHLK